MKIAKGVREANKAIVVDARAVQMSREAEFKIQQPDFYSSILSSEVGSLGHWVPS